MGNSWFQFKKFRIEQENSALRVGTDGVLLGAWCMGPGDGRLETGDGRPETEDCGLPTADCNSEHGDGKQETGEGRPETEDCGLPTADCNSGRGDGKQETGERRPETEDCGLPTADCNSRHGTRILDVGTGTGLITLMLAQRTVAQIDAIEISDAACRDAMDNFRNSPWTDRLKLYKADFNHFIENQQEVYDLIVCNPPFFEQSLRSADPDASLARHDVSLTFEQLIAGSKKLLNEKGRLAVIIPVSAMDDFRETARLCGFYLSRMTTVIPRPGKAPKRVMLEFSAVPVYPVSDELVILKDHHHYSEQFVILTKDFYLNF